MLIYAHRGSHADFPEHSLLAYQQAIIEGADGFECDIRLTKDNKVICWHDDDTARMASEAIKNVVIARSTFSELSFVNPLLFSDFLDLAIKNHKNLAIETKHPVPTKGAIERELLKTLAERDSEIKESGISIAIMSFSWLAVQRVSHSPYPGVYLIGQPIEARLNNAPILGPSLKIIKANPNLIQKLHAQGKKVFVWTVNKEEDVRFCAQNGVDVIMSDLPAQARKALGYA